MKFFKIKEKLAMAEKQMEKQISAGLLGLLDPLIRKWAQELATKIPGDSVLRTETFETFFGAFKGFAEAWSERYPAIVSALIEKLTDFEDFLSVALVDTKHRKTTSQWLNKFLEESAEQLKNASDPQKEFERINLELELIKRLYESACEKTAGNKKEKRDDTENPINSLNAKLESAVQTLKKRKERRHSDATSAKNH